MSDEDYSEEGGEDVQQEPTQEITEPIPTESKETHEEYNRGYRGYTRSYRQRGSYGRRRYHGNRGHHKNYERDEEYRGHRDEPPRKSRVAAAIGCLEE